MTRNQWIAVAVVAAVVVFLLIGWAYAPKPVSPQAAEVLRLTGGGPVGPETQKALDLVEAIRDVHRGSAIRNMGVAQQISCRDAALDAFDASTGKPRYWVHQWKSGRLECFRTGGFHRQSGEPLIEMSREYVSKILGDESSYPVERDGLYDIPSTRPAVSRPSAPVATPAPELGEGPCCK